MAALEADPLKKWMADFLEAMKQEFLAMNRRLDVLEGRLREIEDERQHEKRD